VKKPPIFLSSDQVFSGNKGNYSEEDEKDPCNVYGAHKKIIEDYCLQNKNEILIARISKIFGLEKNDNTLLTDWAKKLENDKTLNCAIDQIISPTYVRDLTRAFDISMKKGIRGLYNIASPEVFSRYDLANLLKKRLNIKKGKIIPCSIKDFDFLDSRALNTSLNVNKFLKDTKFKFSSLDDCIDTLI